MTHEERDILSGQFVHAMQDLFMAMKRVDGTCVEVTDQIDKRDLQVLVWIGDHDNVMMKDIAEVMGAPLSTATGIIQRLVDKRLVMRVASPADRRAVVLQLSNDGREIFRQWSTMRIEAARRMLQGLSEEEVASLLQLLERMVKQVDAHQ